MSNKNIYNTITEIQAVFNTQTTKMYFTKWMGEPTENGYIIQLIGGQTMYTTSIRNTINKFRFSIESRSRILRECIELYHKVSEGLANMNGHIAQDAPINIYDDESDVHRLIFSVDWRA